MPDIKSDVEHAVDEAVAEVEKHSPAAASAQPMVVFEMALAKFNALEHTDQYDITPAELDAKLAAGVEKRTGAEIDLSEH